MEPFVQKHWLRTQSGSPNDITIALSSSSTAYITQKFIFCTKPLSIWRTLHLCVAMAHSVRRASTIAKCWTCCPIIWAAAYKCIRRLRLIESRYVVWWASFRMTSIVNVIQKVWNTNSTKMRSHYRHSESLGTEIEFEIWTANLIRYANRYLYLTLNMFI